MPSWPATALVGSAVAIAFAFRALAAPLDAGPITTTATLPAGAAILDVRDEKHCLEASLPGARCLPAAWLFSGEEGFRTGFHALRWLFGTLGLTGTGTLVVHGHEADARAVASLAFLAGQERVLIHTGPLHGTTESGMSRSLTREAVYSAPMRLNHMAAAQEEPDELRQQLIAFSRTGGTVTFAAAE